MFDELGRIVEAVAPRGKRQIHIAASKPRRLHELVSAIAKGHVGWMKYIEQVAADTKLPTHADELEDNSKPGFGSPVHLYWAKDVRAVVEALRELVAQDIESLRSLTDSDTSSDQTA